MKTLFLSLLTVCFLSQNGTAQECSKYYPFVEGAASQITTYDKRGKTAAIVDYIVTNVRASVGSETATMNSTVKDKNGELIVESSYDVICSDDMVSIDFKSMASPQLFEQFGDMEYEITGTNIDLPNNLSVGLALPDADMLMKINMGGINMNMNLAMTDRNVVAQETITTPAGSFECWVITYSIDMKMGVNQTGTAKQWISEGVGMVKQEDYNRNGKVTSSSLLTAFSK